MIEPDLRNRQHKNSFSLLIISLTALFALLPFYFLIYMPFDPAELENLQATWLVHTGLIPYRDFFEHHSPLFFSIFSFQFHFVEVETAVRTAIRQIFINRVLFWSGSLIVATVVTYLSYLWRGKKAAIFSAAILLSTAMFSRVGIEIHPEGFGAFLWSLTVLVSYLAFVRIRKVLLQILSGVLMGLVIITTQEMILLVLWMTLVAIFTSLVPINLQQNHKRYLTAIIFLAGFTSVILATLLYFANHNTLKVFVDQMLFGYNYPVSPFRNFMYLFIQQPLLFILPLFFGVDVIRSWICKKTVDASEMFFLIVGIGTMINLLVIPAAHQQFFLFLIPILSVISGGVITRFSDWLSKKQHFFKQNLDRAALSEIILLICMLPGVFLTGYTLVTLPKIPQPQLGIISYVFAHTKPGDEVLDGRTGAWLFRSIPWYYWVQHTQIREVIPAEAVDQLLIHMQTDASAPRIANLDLTLSRLTPLNLYLMEHYQSVGTGNLRIRIDTP